MVLIFDKSRHFPRIIGYELMYVDKITFAGCPCLISQNWTTGGRVALHSPDSYQENSAPIFRHRTLQEGVFVQTRKTKVIFFIQ